MIFTLWVAGITAAIFAVPSSRAERPPVPLTRFVQTITVPSVYRGHTARYWHRRYVDSSRRLQLSRSSSRSLRRTLLARSSVAEAINLAGAVYGNSAWLWRVARCESGLNPYARNGGSGSSGLFQFLPSTWATTPFGSFSIWSPSASALAAGWMASRGRSSEWVCR